MRQSIISPRLLARDGLWDLAIPAVWHAIRTGLQGIHLRPNPVASLQRDLQREISSDLRRDEP